MTYPLNGKELELGAGLESELKRLGIQETVTYRDRLAIALHMQHWIGSALAATHRDAGDVVGCCMVSMHAAIHAQLRLMMMAQLVTPDSLSNHYEDCCSRFGPEHATLVLKSSDAMRAATLETVELAHGLEQDDDLDAATRALRKLEATKLAAAVCGSLAVFWFRILKTIGVPADAPKPPKES